MDVKNLLNEAVKMSKWEKIDSGIHEMTILGVEKRLTDKSKREAIVYNGTIKNSKGDDQIINMVDIIDSEDAYKFGATRLIQFLNYFNIELPQEINSIDELVSLANNAVNGKIRIEFVKKLVNGLTIKEKVFVFNK